MEIKWPVTALVARAGAGLVILLTVLACQGPSRLPESRSGETSAVDEVLAVNERLSTAALEGDTATLAELLSEEVVVNDPGNVIRRRDDLLALFASSEVVYRSIETTIDYAGEVGDLVVLMGTESTVLEAAPEGSSFEAGTTLHRRFTNVYRKEGDDWRLVVKQSTAFSVERDRAGKGQ